MTSEELARLKKQMVIKLGTTTTDESEIISNMVDGGSAGALPAVSSTDNGKVLTVAEGAWVAGDAGGGGIMIITDTYDESTGTYTLNNTWQEIYDAFTNGVLPVYKMVTVADGETTVNILYLCGIMGSDNIYKVHFVYVPEAEATLYTFAYTCDSPNDYPTYID